MAEYYPLLAKAVGSLPSSTPDTRRVVYERARKALIGQLRTLHPPVPDEDIERESVELDRAVERLEAEIANGAAPAAPAPPPAKTPAADAKPKKPPPSKPPPPPPAAPTDGSAGPDSSRTAPAPRPPALPERKPTSPRPPLPKPLVPRPARPAAAEKALPPAADAEPKPAPAPEASLGQAEALAPEVAPNVIDARAEDAPPPQERSVEEPRPLKPPQRPIAPQPPGPPTTRRRLWIIPAVVALVVAIIAVAAWKLRDRPETLARKPSEKTQADSGKIAERVGGPGPTASPSNEESTEAKPAAGEQAGSTPPPRPSTNPEVPVARRAALLVEAPDEPNKVKTFVGNVVWKLNNAPQGANATVGLAVEADVDLPDDKLKAVVTFEKNSDASLPASHTIKIRFIPEGGSFTGGIKQISVPQMRPEASPNGEPLAGVTVQIVPNSFLVGLSPGNAEAANTDLMRRLQWVDVPMLLDNGKIAKLTFEKGDSGQRDLNEAFEAWQK